VKPFHGYFVFKKGFCSGVINVTGQAIDRFLLGGGQRAIEGFPFVVMVFAHCLPTFF
jgi:hypothetical protein